jgi:hypothetical protein
VLQRKLALTLLPLASLLASAPAAAELPDKNKDREGWIKGSMAGTPATFCGPGAAKDRTGPADPDFIADQVAKQWDGVAPGDADLDKAQYLANAICKFPGNPDLQKRLMPLWDAWVAHFGFGKADLADIATLFDKSHKRIPRPDRAPADTRLADAEGPMQVLVAKANQTTSYNMGFMSLAEMLDTLAAPSQHLVAAFVAECVDSYHGSIGRWAICKQDALGLDRKKLDAELAKDTIDPSHRLEAKIKFVRLQAAVKAAQAKYAAEADKDGGVEKVIDTVPAAAAKEWAELSGKHGALLAWSYKMIDDARLNSKKPFDGCEADFLTHLTPYLTEKKPATTDALKDAFKDNIGSQLAAGAERCFVRNAAAQKFWADQNSGHGGYRGLRTTIWHALAGAAIEFDKDRGSDGMGLPPAVTLYARGTSSSSSGTIATAKETGDNLDITFKKETWKEKVCQQWKETNKIDGISNDGKLIYRTTCVKTGTETRSSTAEPVSVPKQYAAGLKVGVAASFARNSDGAGYPVAIYADKKREKLAGAFGVTY